MLGIADSLNVSVTAAVLLYEARRQRGLPAHVRSRRREVAPGMDRFQFVVIGAGPAGEAAAIKARESSHRRRRRSAVVRWQLPAHRLRPVEVVAPLRGGPRGRR